MYIKNPVLYAVLVFKEVTQANSAWAFLRQ